MTNEEIDREVAEKVMGWPASRDGKRTVVLRVDGTQDFHDGTKWRMNWSPSTDMSAAWQIMENLKSREPFACACEGGWRCIMDASDDPEDTETSEMCGGYTINRRRVAKTHESAPMAICLTALATLKQEGEEAGGEKGLRS